MSQYSHLITPDLQYKSNLPPGADLTDSYVTSPLIHNTTSLQFSSSWASRFKSVYAGECCLRGVILVHLEVLSDPSSEAERQLPLPVAMAVYAGRMVSGRGGMNHDYVM
ncbi:uncharacterized protein MYCFIDRAFT_170405 [Pseudocercospora fijiensis CIRAD86]|uniref:Uncharacterized protein n=1 Tax=Pseudocercospora fijiensis (strain CIRAD86) TaxID=383855 RepID=N1QAF8_PSEFD|nr:uncharacterized protein MYCFIDRAFT_170405 [Pseudocercospora fijiensis CIRAD86]EME88836.1 hypothetical protein MYCFIDRAFT_170405 [Pseudocercospora fijiensis CIRAD86]